MTFFTQLVKQNSFWFCVEMKNRKTVDNKHFRILAVLAFNLPYIQRIVTKSPMINEANFYFWNQLVELVPIKFIPKIAHLSKFLELWKFLSSITNTVWCCFAMLCRCHPKVNDANDKCIYFVRISGTFYLKFVQSNGRMRKHRRRYIV